MTRQTSIETYHQIVDEGLLSPLREKVYQALFKHGPCTANELVYFMRQDGQKTKSRDYFAQRLSELRELGVVKETGKRPCRVTGRVAITWQTTNEIPKKSKKKFRICEHCGGTGKLELEQLDFF